MKQVSGQMSLFDRDMPCGKMSLAHFQATKVKTSESCSKSSAKSKTPTPIFLDLRGASGILAEPSWVTGIPSHGEFSMRAFGECPNVVEESGLWQILEANVPQKYFLSARACAGVLRRAERRGKELPTILKTALEQQIERWEKDGSPLPVFDVSVHNNRITDYTSLVCESYAENSSRDGIAGTIDSHYYLGCGARGGKEREFIVCQYQREIGTLCADDYKGINNQYVQDNKLIVENVFCVGNGQADQAKLHKKVGALNCMHDQQAIMYPVYCLQGNGIDRADTAGCNGKGVTENVSYTLNTVDRHAVCCEAEGHTHDFLVRMREGKDGGGKGALVQEDKSGTIACNNDQVLFQRAETQYIVRRLTPLECCRLQGMPDFWTDGVEGSDAARYKLWGNGMALPNALYIMEGIAEVGTDDER